MSSAGCNPANKDLQENTGTRQRCRSPSEERDALSDKVLVILTALLAHAVYLRTLAPSVAVADGYELQVASATLGVAHPTGYPLYTLLGKLFTLLPVGDLAYRVNLFSAASAAAGIALVAATILSFAVSHDVPRRPSVLRLAPAVVGGLTLAFSLTYWQQAVVAEKYALNAAFVAAMLYLLSALVAPGPRWRPSLTMLAVVYGLSLTHHRTMLLLVPALCFAVGWWALRVATAEHERHLRRSTLRDFLASLLAGARSLATPTLAFVVPLSLYAYLPLRRPMSWGEFLQELLGSEYQGALRWGSWLSEPDRVEVFIRLGRSQLPEHWIWVGIGLGAIGLAWLFWRRPAYALASSVGAAMVTLFAASYYADYNDANYLLPTYVILATWIGAGCAVVLNGLWRMLGGPNARLRSSSSGGGRNPNARSLATTSVISRWAAGAPTMRFVVGTTVAIAFAVLPAGVAGANLARADASGFRRHLDWSLAALPQVPAGATVLAHAERFAALDYLARVGPAGVPLRPDLAVETYPSEGEYLERIEADLKSGRPVYTERRVFGASYAAEAVGPWTHLVSKLDAAPTTTQGVARWGRLVLLRATIEPPRGQHEIGADLEWLAREPLGQNLRFRLRLVDERGVVWAQEEDGIPVNRNLPTPAWPAGALIRDHHSLPLPPGLPPSTYRVELGVHLDFHNDTVSDDDGQPYVTLGTVSLEPDAAGPVRPWSLADANFGDALRLAGYDLGQHAEAGGTVRVRLYWQALGAADALVDPDTVVRLVNEDGIVMAESTDSPLFALFPPARWPRMNSDLWQLFRRGSGISGILTEERRLAVPSSISAQPAASAPARVRLEVAARSGGAELPLKAGWLTPSKTRFALPWREVAPSHPQHDDRITIPANFGDRLLLLAAGLESSPVHPGDYLNLLLDWEALAPTEEDYVIFVQLNGNKPNMWVQEDRAPATGAYQTRRWRQGERVRDRHRISLPWTLPPGSYQLNIGVYRPSDLSRLPIVDEHSMVIGDIVTPLTVEIRPR